MEAKISKKIINIKIPLGIIILAFFITINDNLAYKNCMTQTKMDYATEKGEEHAAAICKAFLLEKLMSVD